MRLWRTTPPKLVYKMPKNYSSSIMLVEDYENYFIVSKNYLNLLRVQMLDRDLRCREWERRSPPKPLVAL